MDWFGIIGVTFGVFGICYAGRFYWELRRWAYLVKYGRIVVAYKGKVKLNAPIQEWALWCKMAEEDKSSNGRVLYTLGGTRIAVLRQSFVPDPPLLRVAKAIIQTWKLRRLTKTGPKTGPQVREGAWSAEDHTKKVT